MGQNTVSFQKLFRSQEEGGCIIYTASQQIHVIEAAQAAPAAHQESSPQFSSLLQLDSFQGSLFCLMLMRAPVGFLTSRLPEGPTNQQFEDCCLLKVARDQKCGKNLLWERVALLVLRAGTSILAILQRMLKETQFLNSFRPLQKDGWRDQISLNTNSWVPSVPSPPEQQWKADNATNGSSCSPPNQRELAAHKTLTNSQTVTCVHVPPQLF